MKTNVGKYLTKICPKVKGRFNKNYSVIIQSLGNATIILTSKETLCVPGQKRKFVSILTAGYSLKDVMPPTQAVGRAGVVPQNR